MRFLTKALGWLLIASGLVMVATQVDLILEGKHDNVTVGLVLSVFFLAGGGLLVRAGRRMKRGEGDVEPAGAVPGPSLEERILTVARAHKGHVTAVEAAADGQMTVEQAREELERLAKENACLMEVSADGLVFFRFPEFENHELTS